MNPKLEKFLLFLVILTDVNRTVLSFDSKCPSLKLVNGRIRYRWRGRSIRFNCMKGFQLVGEKNATCMNGNWNANVPICVRYGCRAPSSTHINGQFIESYRGAVVKIVCNPGYTLVGSPSVYCNGNHWNEPFPVCRVTNTKPALSCDFDSSDLCGWTQDPMHDFDWKRQNGFTPSGDNGTGPMFDHTRGANNTGYYMYLESSSPRVKNDTARLYSPVYPAEYSNGTCFKFWYHMYGPTTGVLKVYVKPEEVEFFDLIPSFWINGGQGSSWILGFFRIDQLESPFQIVIEGTRGPGAVGDTAFDDVALTSAEECAVLEAIMSSTEFSTSVSTDPGDDAIDLLSCQNRCNETKSNRTADEDACSCYETCDRDGTCCLNYFDVCAIFPSSSTTTSKQTESYTMESFSSKTQPTTSSRSSPTPTAIQNPSRNDFNNESNEINPNKPFPMSPGDVKPNRTSNEIPRQGRTTTVPKPKSTVEIVTGEKVQKRPETNPTKIEQKRKEGKVVESPKPNNIKLTFLDKPSGPVQPNEAWYRKRKDSGKDTPQAIKIDKKEENGGKTLRGMIEIGGTSLAVLVIIVLGVVWYRRRENWKSERKNMMEDSDSIIVYNLDSSAAGCESHSLVGIRPGSLQPSASPNLFK